MAFSSAVLRTVVPLWTFQVDESTAVPIALETLSRSSAEHSPAKVRIAADIVHGAGMASRGMIVLQDRGELGGATPLHATNDRRLQVRGNPLALGLDDRLHDRVDQLGRRQP